MSRKYEEIEHITFLNFKEKNRDIIKRYAQQYDEILRIRKERKDKNV